jgi:nucleotide-binding universal stress UspA family protein
VTIVCGIDFLDGAAKAARIAAGLAQRLGERLVLVHVIEPPGATLWTKAADDPIRETPRTRLEAEAALLCKDFGVDVEAVIETGDPHDRLVEAARRHAATLVVIASLGAKKHRWQLGSVAERVARAAPMPVLVVRDGATLEAWARGEGKLRVMVAVEPTAASRAAFEWARGLRDIGACELVLARIVWPAEEHRRLGITAPMPLDHLRPELESALLHDLRQWAGEPSLASEVSFVVRAGWGRVDTHVARLASERNADLLVLGTNQRAGVALIWQGSVSRGVLHSAPMSVVTVPRARSAR